jgi:general secretion pathway protein M
VTIALPPIASRVLALAILLLLVVGLYVLVIDPLVAEYQANRDAVEQLSAALGRYRAAGLRLPEREQALESLRKADPVREGFLQGANDNLIAANIQARVKSITEAARGELRSTQSLPALDEGKLHRIAIRAQMTVTLGAAQKVFYGIESGTPYLFLDNVVMNARVGLRRRGEADDNPLIDVQFDVFGYTHSSSK